MFDNNNSSSECSPLYSQASYGNVAKNKSQKSTSHETSLQSSLKKKTKKKTCQGKRVAFTSDLSDKEIDPECHNNPTRNSEKVCPALKNSYKYPAKKSSLVSKPKRIVGCVRYQDENSSISQNRKSLQQTTRRCLDPGFSQDEGSCLTNSEGLQTSSRNSTPRKAQLAGRPICREISKSGQWSHYDAGVYSWASQDDDKDDTRAETSSLVEGVDTSEDLERTGYSSISDWWTSDPLSSQELDKLHSLDCEDSRRVQQSLSLAKTKSNSSRLQPSSSNGVKKGFTVEKVKVKCSGSGRESLHTPAAVTERAEPKSKSFCNGKVSPSCLATRPARREVGSLSSAAASLARSDAILAGKRKERDSKCRPAGPSLRTRYSRSMADSRSNDPLVKFVERQHTRKRTRSLSRHSSLRLPATSSQQTNIHGDFVQHKINISLKKISDDKLKGNPTQCEEKIFTKSNAIDLPKHSMRLDPNLKHLLVYNAFTSQTPKEESARPTDQALEKTNTIKPGSSIHVDLSRSLSGSVSESSIGIQCDILSPDSALSCNPLSPSSQHARRVASMYPAEDEVEATRSQHWASSGVDLSLDSEFVSCVSIGVQCEGSLFTSLLTLAWEDSTTAQVDSLALDQSNVFESQMKGSHYDNIKVPNVLQSPLTNGLKTEHMSRTLENCVLDPGNTSLQNTESLLEQVSRKLFQTNRTNGDQSLKQREIEMKPNSAEMFKTADDNSPQKRLITKSEGEKSQDGALLEHGRKSNTDHSEKNPDKNTTQPYKMRADSRENYLQYESTIQDLVHTKEALSAQHSTLKDKVKANKRLQSNQQETELEQPQLAQQHEYTEQLLSAQRTMPAEQLLSGQRTIPAEQLLSGQRTIPAEQLLSGQRTIPAEQLLSGQRTIPAEQLLSGQRTIQAEQLLSAQRTIPAEQLLSGQRTIPAEQLLSGQRTIPAEQLLSAQRTIPSEQLLSSQKQLPTDQLQSSQKHLPTEQLISTQKQQPTEQLISTQRQLQTEKLISTHKQLPTEQRISTQKHLPNEQLLSAQKQLPTQQHSIRPENARIDKDPSVLSESQTTYSGLSAEERTPGRSSVGDTLSKEQKINSNVYFNATDSRDSKSLRQENEATNSQIKSLRQENQATNLLTKLLPLENEATNWQLYGGENNLSSETFHQVANATHDLGKEMRFSDLAIERNGVGSSPGRAVQLTAQPFSVSPDQRNLTLVDLPQEQAKLKQANLTYRWSQSKQSDLTHATSKSKQTPMQQEPSMQKTMYQEQSFQKLMQQEPSIQKPMQQEPSGQKPMQQEPSGQKPMQKGSSMQKSMQQEPSMEKLMQQEHSLQKPKQEEPSLQKPMQQEPSMQKPMLSEKSLPQQKYIPPEQSLPQQKYIPPEQSPTNQNEVSPEQLKSTQFLPKGQAQSKQILTPAEQSQLKEQFLKSEQLVSKQNRKLSKLELSEWNQKILPSEQIQLKKSEQFVHQQNVLPIYQTLPQQQLPESKQQNLQADLNSKSQFIPSEQLQSKQQFIPSEQLQSKQQFIPSDQLQSKQQFIPSEQLQSKQQFIPTEQLQSKQQSIPSEQLQSKQQFIPSEQLQSKQQSIPSEQLQSKQQFIPSEQLQSKQQFIPTERRQVNREEQLHSKKQFIPSEQLQSSKQQFISSEQLQSSKQQFIPSEQLQSSKQQFIPSEQLQSSKQQFIPSEQPQSSKQQFIPSEQLQSKQQFIPSEKPQSKQQFIPTEQLQSKLQFIPPEKLVSKHQFHPTEQHYLNQQLSPEMAQLNHQNVRSDQSQRIISSEQIQSNQKHLIPSELHSSESAQSTKAQNQPRLAHQLTDEQKQPRLAHQLTDEQNQPRLAHQLTEESSLKVRTQFNVGKPNPSMKVSLKPSFNPTALSNTSRVEELRTLPSKDHIHLDNERTSRDLEKNVRSHSKTPDDTNKPSVFSNDTFEVSKAFPLLDSKAEAGKTIGGLVGSKDQLVSKKTSSTLDRTHVSANVTRATANNIPIVQVTPTDDQITGGNKSIATDNKVPLNVSFNPMSKLEVTDIKEHNSSLLLSKGEKRVRDPKYRIPPGAEEWYRNNRLLSMEIVLGPQPVFDLKPPASGHRKSLDSVKTNKLLASNKEALTSNLKGKISLTKSNTTFVTNGKANKSFPKSTLPKEAIIESARNSIESDLPFNVFVDNKTKLTSDRVRNSTSSDKPIYREDNLKQDTPDKTKTAIYNIFGRRKSFNTPDVKKIPADDPKYSSVNVVPKNQPIERKPQKMRKNAASKYSEQTRSKSNMSPLLKILQNSSKPFLKSDEESDALFNQDMTNTLKTFRRKGKPGKDRSEDNIIDNLQESNKNALSNSPSTSSDNSRENRHYVSTYLSEKSENLDTSINTELSSKSGDHGQPIGASSYQHSGSEKAQTHLSGVIEEDKSKVIRGHHDGYNSLNSKNTVISLELPTTLNEMNSFTDEDAGFSNDSVKAKLDPYLNAGSLISPNIGTLGYDDQLNVAFESSVDPEITQHPKIDAVKVQSATKNLFSTPVQDIIKVYGSSVDLDHLPENDITSAMDALDHSKQLLPTVTAESGEKNEEDRSTIVIDSRLNEKHSPTVALETNQKGDNLSTNDVFDARSSETSHKTIYLTDNIGAKLFMEIPQREELYSEMVDSKGDSIQETSSIESLEIAAALASSTDDIFPVQPETVEENRLTEQQRGNQSFLKSRDNRGSWFKNNDDSGIGSLKSPIFNQDRQRESVRKRPKLAPQLPTFSSFIDKRKWGNSSFGQRKKKEPPKAKPRVVSECFYYSDLNMMQLTLKPVNWPTKSHESPGDLSTHAININFHTSPMKKPSSTLIYSRARSQSMKRSVNV